MRDPGHSRQAANRQTLPSWLPAETDNWAFWHESTVIMIAMGQIQQPVFGHEACDTVSGVASETTGLSCGARVVFVGPGALRNHIRAHESVVQGLPDNMSFDEAASIPIAYVTARRSLVEVARLEKGESVLVHAVPEGKILL